MSYSVRYWEKYFPAFVACEDPVIQEIITAARRIEIPAGQIVFSMGSRCENYLLMLEGSIKTQLLSENGRQMLLYHVGPGDSCTLTTSCLLGGNRYPAEGITEQDAVAFIVPQDLFERALDQSSFFRQFVFNNFAKRLAALMTRMEEVMFNPIDTRLAKLLLDYHQPLIQVTHNDLAVTLGSAREVVSRHLKRYELLGCIKLHRGSLEITDPEALRELSSGAGV